MGLFEKRMVSVAAFLALIVLALAGIALRQAARETQEALLSQSMGPVVSLLEMAHRDQDDVALQRLVHGITSAPGVLWAGVLDAKQQRVIVHSDPARMGEKWDHERISWHVPLDDGHTVWGHLTIGFSESLLGGFNRQVFFWGIAWAAVFVLLVFVQAGYGYRRASLHHAEKGDAAAAHAELQEALSKAQNQAQEQELVSQQCLQSALEQIPRPCLLLDRHQRVAACNSMSALLLGVGLPAELIGRPWQDIPTLAECGRPLAESLENPQRTFRVTLSQQRVTVDLWSLEVLSGFSPGTWITLYPSTP